MIDEPPAVPAAQQRAGEPASRSLPTVERADGSLLIDLMPLAPQPRHCKSEERNSFNPEIVVCRETVMSPRLGADYGPMTDEVVFGSAVPRAKIQLTDDVAIEANAISPAVGGLDAEGVEARVTIDFQ